MASYPIEARGARDEALSTDVALIGDAKAERLLIMTSATHGAEGFCGSGCQLALLDDAPMLARARFRRGLLLVHAVNPYGFSWIARTDEGNVDLNRNAQPFDGRPLPENPGYGALHPLLLPESWPPTEANQREQERYIAEHGLATYAQAVSRGQYTHADGLFYGGDRPAASLLNMRRILKEHAAAFSASAGSTCIRAGAARPRREDLRRPARRGRSGAGAALVRRGHRRAYQGSSASVDITGQLASVIYDACPTSTPTLMALEFGTQPLPTWCRRCVAATGCARIRKPARTRAGPF